MQIAIALLMVFHGFIHLLGFLKAFQIAEMEELKQPVTRQRGIFWLTAFILFLITAILYISQLWYWMIFAIISAIISQSLIITSWEDAKFGTIPNIFLLLLLVLSVL